MIAYGTRIHTKLPLAIDLPEDTAAQFDISLIEGVPEELRAYLRSGCCGLLSMWNSGIKLHFLRQFHKNSQPVCNRPTKSDKLSSVAF
jgi:hypothetical protein